ncbi:hypothetical protein GGI12_003818 [Dipsacomyces acuminosporus]|nr:hypothetical protein GGI12_003818 [Dipsacomyces acuminosporus]
MEDINPAGGNSGSGGLTRRPAIRLPSGSRLRPTPTRAASNRAFNGRVKRADMEDADPAGGSGARLTRRPAIRRPSGSGLRPRPTRAASNGRIKRDNQARSSPYPTPGPMAKRADMEDTNPSGGSGAKLTRNNAIRRPKSSPPARKAKRADMEGTNPAGGNGANLTRRNATRRPKPKRDSIPSYPTPFVAGPLY